MLCYVNMTIILSYLALCGCAGLHQSRLHSTYIGLFSLRQLQRINSIIIMLHVMLSELRLWGTCLCHVITVTRVMQPMPILKLCSTQSVLDSNLFRPTHFLTDAFLTGVWIHDSLAPPTEIHKF